ncbi:MAG: fused DSP-PTPase phosphatase/NAD kinase-like protein [Planctomycetota bacterium]
MPSRATLALLTLLASAVAGGTLHCATGSPVQLAPHERPATWAERLDVRIVPNFHKVSDTLYRGAQPPASGFKELQRRGIKTVINLREWHTDDQEIGDLQLANIHIPTDTFELGDAEVIAFLKAVTNPANQPVFVHCRHGSDRTGTMCAIYRILVQGWDRKEAIREMMHGDMGFHAMFENLPEYIRNADLEKLRREAGLAK